ncbi:unnamed protein product [Nippostrongylus brasiliensis]|uniref:RNase H domain-containing protein n=1 Tax=Nippostrongylus brasiliensis TaxID=27835 RepID=A0A0N4Y5K0_NIPBR|nr:unnamed protein product [Nippostrongylus brasiliensis]
MRWLPNDERPRLQKLVRIGTLNETRWKGEKAKEIGDGVKLFYKGDDGKRNGVGIAISEALKDSVTIISVYAPQTGCSEEDKDEFDMTLDDVIRSVLEGRGIGRKKEDGERIIDLAVVHDFAICITFFTKRERQKVNYSSGGRRAKIDHILVRRQALKTVKDVKLLPGEDVTTQHKPLVADLSITLPRKQKHKPLVADLSITLPRKQKVRTEPRIRWWKLRGPERNELRNKVMIAGLPDPNGAVNDTWTQAARTTLQCAKETLGETRGGSTGDRAA